MSYFDRGDNKTFPYSKTLARLDEEQPIKYGSRENVAYLQGKLSALKDIENWQKTNVRDHTTYFGTRPLYGYFLMTQDIAEDMAGRLIEPQEQPHA